MSHTFDIKIWSVRQRTKQQSAEVRWKVGTTPHSATFRTKTLADNRRAQLMVAVQRGEAFDEATGLPLSELRKQGEVSWYEHARNYIEMKWPDSPASTRRTLAEAMATVTPALVEDSRGMADPRTVRQALYSWAFNKHRWGAEPPEDVRAVLSWFERKSLPTSALTDRVVTRRALDALKRRLDGTTAAASSIRRKRAIFHNAVVFAVESELLSENPIPRVSWSLPEPVEEEVDPATVPNPEQVRAQLRAVGQQGSRGRRLVAFLGCVYYAGARPAEVVGLKLSQCTLPRRGWGRLRLQETRPRSGRAWTDSGQAHDRRGLKKRSRKTVRSVPIPPELVAMLRWHIEAYGVAPDGRLFRTLRGGLLPDSGYGQVWARARKEALSPEEAERLAKRVYDLRVAALSAWLAAGADPQTVAKRAGHTVAVLLRVYAKFIDDSDNATNTKIAARLAERSGTPV
ncbi:tyrosine-type recombinase/integrase [Streptomyces radicis]|uniref:Site-specific integrase n=1 Tax=Streptomyces radicis TaxID=1750517 RepID=A0A3A9WHA2_9ACTN|nr:tyrosine-type recombinase/integrase [Streptomyces radicis]RKN05497.1 site-specific integrase [Streptomyces radicis]RKN17366.1 site-specific integrase [Streptomyces radicis]